MQFNRVAEDFFPGIGQEISPLFCSKNGICSLIRSLPVCHWHRAAVAALTTLDFNRFRDL